MVVIEPHECFEMKPASFAISLQNSLDELGRASTEIRGFLAQHPVNARAAYSVDLILEEIATNTFRYGYDGEGPHSIAVTVSLAPHAITLSIEDDGREFNPLAAPIPEPAEDLEHTPLGGKGLLLVRAMIRSGEYQRIGSRNKLVLQIDNPG